MVLFSDDDDPTEAIQPLLVGMVVDLLHTGDLVEDSLLLILLLLPL